MVNIKSTKLGALLLAGSALCAIQTAHAQSCNTSAWTSTTGSPVAGSPLDNPSVRRYSGACGLAPALPGPSFVVESTQHAAEGNTSPYSARFYVYTGITAGTPVVFRAVDGSDATVIDVVYDAAQQNFDFTVNGVTRSTAASSAPRNRWIGVQLQYQAGQQFSAATRSAGAETAVDTAGMNAGAAVVEAVQLGVVAANGASGNLYFDEFEASRAAGGSNPIAPACRGDANGDGNINVFDTIQAINERLNGTLVAGQPDCNEDGSVNVFDTICIIGLRIASTTCTP